MSNEPTPEPTPDEGLLEAEALQVGDHATVWAFPLGTENVGTAEGRWYHGTVSEVASLDDPDWLRIRFTAGPPCQALAWARVKKFERLADAKAAAAAEQAPIDWQRATMPDPRFTALHTGKEALADATLHTALRLIADRIKEHVPDATRARFTFADFDFLEVDAVGIGDQDLSVPSDDEFHEDPLEDTADKLREVTRCYMFVFSREDFERWAPMFNPVKIVWPSGFPETAFILELNYGQQLPIAVMHLHDVEKD